MRVPFIRTSFAAALALTATATAAVTAGAQSAGAQTCQFLAPVGGDGTTNIVTKTISPGTPLPFSRPNWNTDFFVTAPYSSYKFFFTANSSVSATYPVEGFLKFTDGTSFQVINELGLGEIEPGNFRTIFRHAAIGVGASAQIIANGESIVTTVSAGTSIKIEQRLLTLSDIPSPVGITFATPTSGIAAEPSPPTDLWGTTCEMATTAFYLIGSPADNLPLQVLRAPRRCLIASNCL